MNRTGVIIIEERDLSRSKKKSGGNVGCGYVCAFLNTETKLNLMQ